MMRGKMSHTRFSILFIVSARNEADRLGSNHLKQIKDLIVARADYIAVGVRWCKLHGESRDVHTETI